MSHRNRRLTAGSHSRDVSRLIRLNPQIWCPDERDVCNGVHDSERGRLLLLGLAASTRYPSEDDAVDSIGADGEYDHGEVLRPEVQSRATQHETKNSNCFCRCDMPRPFVVFTGLPRPVDADNAGDQVWWAGQNQGYRCGEAQSVDNLNVYQ